MEDLTGKQLGQYQIVEPLGEGGMAAVYKAFQPGMERYVALKILPRMFADDPTFVGRFKQEAKVIAKLTHVHILPIFDFGTADGYTYIVMPYIKTGDLADMMTGKPLPIPFVRKVISQIGDALQYAHSRGLVHRDIKPSNILIDDRENCLLSDFGIAKIVGGTMQFTQTGAIIGTPAYMSPEQINGEELDGRNDIYSLGIVLYEMVTGRPPFKAETPPAIFVKHLHDPMPPPRNFAPDISEELEAVILKSLARDREDRYANVSDMVEALKKAIPEEHLMKPEATMVDDEPAPTVVEKAPAEPKIEEKEPVLAETEVAPEKVIPEPTPVEKPVRKMPTWVWAVGGFVIVAIIVVGVMFGGDLFGGGEPVEPTEKPPVAQPIDEEPAPVDHVVPEPREFECEDPLGCVVIPPGAPVRIGYGLAMGGDFFDLFGGPSVAAIEIAIDETVELHGHPLELVGVDTGCSPEGVEALHDLVGDPWVVGIIGTTCSGPAEMASRIVSESGGVLISPSNTRTTLTDPNQHWHPGYLRTAWNDMLEITSLAEFIYHEVGVRQIAVINDTFTPRRYIAEIFIRKSEMLGSERIEWFQFNPETDNLEDLLNHVAEFRPELVYVVLPHELAIEIIHRMQERPDLSSIMLASYSNNSNPEFLDALGGAGEGMWFAGVNHEFHNDIRAHFDERFIDRYGEPNHSPYTYYAYDATRLLLDTIERTATSTDNRSLIIPRQQLRDRLYGTFDWPGITGNLTCTEFGDCANPIIVILEAMDRDLVEVFSYEPLADPMFEYELFFIP